MKWYASIQVNRVVQDEKEESVWAALAQEVMATLGIFPPVER